MERWVKRGAICTHFSDGGSVSAVKPHLYLISGAEYFSPGALFRVTSE